MRLGWHWRQLMGAQREPRIAHGLMALCVWDTRARQNGALSSNSWRGTGWEILTKAGSLATVFDRRVKPFDSDDRFRHGIGCISSSPAPLRQLLRCGSVRQPKADFPRAMAA